MPKILITFNEENKHFPPEASRIIVSYLLVHLPEKDEEPYMEQKSSK